MLDLSKARRRKRVALPSLVKFAFLLLPWGFVAYGTHVLQDMLAFYNNSIPASAEVVLADASNRPVDADEARLADVSDDLFYRPGFLYTHENGRSYVGGAIVESVNWSNRPGEIVDVRYNRLVPGEAQPVTLLKFWWSPASFIIGGLLGFLSLMTAFWLAEREPVETPRPRRKPRRGLSLNRR